MTEVHASVRVLVVDDSVVIRRLLTDIIDAEPDMEAVATAANGKLAVEKIERLNPDVITLDVEMPTMDGIATLRELRSRGIRKPVIMFSTLTERGAAATLDAMALGASDYVTKPSNTGSFDESRERVRGELVPKIRALGPRVVVPRRTRPRPAKPARADGPPVDVVAIGCSTGGPNALAEVIPTLPAELAVPVLIVQHMPPVFTGLLARRLDETSRVHVVEAEAGMTLDPGVVYVAPGDHHMVLDADGTSVTIELNQELPENSCRPAVDPLFRSVAAVYGRKTLGIVLTGMGHDGLEGARALKALGAPVFVQDEETSVVWGMPGAVADAELADGILPLSTIPSVIQQRVRKGSITTGAAS